MFPSRELLNFQVYCHKYSFLYLIKSRLYRVFVSFNLIPAYICYTNIYACLENTRSVNNNENTRLTMRTQDHFLQILIDNKQHYVLLGKGIEMISLIKLYVVDGKVVLHEDCYEGRDTTSSHLLGRQEIKIAKHCRLSQAGFAEES
ncbi:hypothetical protein K2173_007386 [Erythroxylum novogranatense]|uniref:Uncharacterized protein n=1 Tax=Erythroxylum novogranatense TaxID=1862640 RepID=A0AAV8T7K2_9ROSI|nr:hypothetical protein K2173_007386 [Erythroxylum novogranatense]